jgi:hypothetical protein
MKSEWQTKCAALEDAFRRQAIQPASKMAGIPYEFFIPDMGQQLLLMTPIQHPKCAPDKKGLLDLAQSTGRTIKVLERLSENALTALNYRRPALASLKTNLRILHVAAKTAEVKARRGAPKKIQPRKITEVVAQHYYGLTGKKPTVPSKDGKAYGPFLELLGDIFKILGVKGVSAESQARELVKGWKSVVAKFSL